MHFRGRALHKNAGNCIPVVVAVADKLLVASDVMDPAEAAEEELALEGPFDVTDELPDAEQAAACGSTTPTLIIKGIRMIDYLEKSHPSKTMLNTHALHS